MCTHAEHPPADAWLGDAAMLQHCARACEFSVQGPPNLVANLTLVGVGSILAVPIITATVDGTALCSTGSNLVGSRVDLVCHHMCMQACVSCRLV